MKTTVSGLHSAGPEALSGASRRVTRHIRALGCPADLQEELHAALAEAGLAESRLAVRSSAVDEDSARHSFAGLMETRLNAAAPDVPAALVEVWASAFSPAALAYRQARGLDLRRIRTAVIVQEMVPAVSAGVLFTRDPDAAARGEAASAVIVAAWGLGEGVVRGAVETDTYRVGESVAGQVTRKTSRVVPDEVGGTRTEAVPESLRHRAVLTGDQVRRLAEVGATVERASGTPQDLEWAFDGQGRLFVLQSRPIVRPEPSRVEASAERRLWDNSNIVESYPGLTLPLTFSFVRTAYAQAFEGACAAFFPLGNPLEAQPHLFSGLLGLLDGRVYYNLHAWYEMFSYLARPEQHRRTWDRMVGVSRAATSSPTPENARPLHVRAMAALGALRVLLGVRRIGRRFAKHFDTFYRRHRDAAEASSAAELAIRYRRLEREAARFWHLTLFTDLCAMRYHGWVAALAARWIPEHEDLASRLLGAEEGIESVAPARSLAALVERVRSEPRWHERLAQQSDADLWRALRSEASLAPLREAIDAHVEAFGDRGIEELKLETVTFREEPRRLLSLIRRSLDTGPSVEARREAQTERRREAEAIVVRRLRGPRRFAFQMVLGRARTAIRNRENMRFARSRLFGIVRALFRRLGEKLSSAGCPGAGRRRLLPGHRRGPGRRRGDGGHPRPARPRRVASCRVRGLRSTAPGGPSRDDRAARTGPSSASRAGRWRGPPHRGEGLLRRRRHRRRPRGARPRDGSRPGPARSSWLSRRTRAGSS